MADTTERLLLQVDAATELLRRNLAEGEQPLDRFERRAAKMAENVDGSIGQMGKRFGAFAVLADDAAARAQRSFEASFSQVQRLASTAIKGPTIDGGINLGAEDIRAGAAAAQDQARAFALIGEAAERAALAERDTSEATRLFIQATAASRIEAEQKAAALLAEAGALERVEIELRQSAEATELFVGKHQRIAQATAEQNRLAIATGEASREQRALAASADMLRAELDPMYLAQKRFDDELNRADTLLAAGIIHQREYSAAIAQARGTLYAHAQAVTGAGTNTNQLSTNTNALRYAMQGASYQVQDTFTQISMGANVLNVVAIQGGQLAGQFANIEGKAGSVARFMIGPWGLAITGALLVLGPLTKGLFEFGDATDEAVDKLKKDAIESDVAARAKARFAGSVEGLTIALRDQDKALRETASSERSAAERANISARTKRDEALATRQQTVALLEQAKARLAVLSTPGASDARLAPARDEVKASIEGLEARLKTAQSNVDEAARQLNVTRVDLAAEEAAIALDPVRSVTKLYDDRIRALKNEQREQARLGKQIGAESKARLQQLEAEKKAAIETAQARQRAANAKPNNNQIGREINVAEATSIIAGIGGRVTSGYRSTERQAQIYADKLAGRHNGPVARPGSSKHEVGQAIDVAYGAGISESSIKQAFAREGVRVTKLINERAQGVFHVEFGKKGPSQQTIDNKAEIARQKVLSDDIAYGQEEQAARQRLAAATRKSAQSEDDRYRETVAAINADAEAQKSKIDLQQEKGLAKPRADNLRTLNEQTRKQQLQNAAADRALAILDQRFDAEQQNLESELAVLRISEDMALTDRDRRRIGLQILEAEQQQRRLALERVRDTSKDPTAVASAQRSIAALPKIETAERGQFEQRTAGALDTYRQRLKATTADTNAALEEIGVRGLGNLEDKVASAAGKVLGLKGAFGDFVGSAIADLARLAFKMAALAAIDALFPGSGSIGRFLTGKAGGGKIEGKAGGGRIMGPGTGTSDSILALIDGRKPLMVSNGESIVTAEATARFWPIIDAMNKGRLPGLAGGGIIGSPSLPSLRSPSLPVQARGGGQQSQRLLVEGEIGVKASPEFDAKMERVSFRTVAATAEPIMAGAQGRTMRALRRPSLPGAPG